jgi:hypothetical protein
MRASIIRHILPSIPGMEVGRMMVARIEVDRYAIEPANARHVSIISLEGRRGKTGCGQLPPSKAKPAIPAVGIVEVVNDQPKTAAELDDA